MELFKFKIKYILFLLSTIIEKDNDKNIKKLLNVR